MAEHVEDPEEYHLYVYIPDPNEGFAVNVIDCPMSMFAVCGLTDRVSPALTVTLAADDGAVTKLLSVETTQ